MNLFGIYGGAVEDNRDPERLGRLKIRVPHVYGSVESNFGYVPTNDLPWALPVGSPAGGSSSSGGISMLPSVGDQMAVQFLDGEPEKPVWQWMMQNQSQAKNLKLHQYDDKGFPSRAIFTRYGHSLELTEAQVILTTSQGYQIVLGNSDSASGGSATIRTPKGQSFDLNDLRGTGVFQTLNSAVISSKKVILNATTSALVKSTRFTLMAGTSLISVQGDTVSVATGTGATLLIDAAGNIALASAGGSTVSVENKAIQVGSPGGTGFVIEDGKISANAPQVVFNSSAFSVGTAAGSPVLLLTQSMLTWLLTHTHTNGNNGSPTGPPIPLDPQFPVNAASQRMQTS